MLRMMKCLQRQDWQMQMDLSEGFQRGMYYADRRRCKFEPGAAAVTWAIARSGNCSPPVLILDEATSSIDTRTERIVQEGMDKLMEGRTTFVIAHRLSTVRNSDCIMVLEQGRIIERGTHEQLIGEQGRYYQLYTGNSISA